MVAPGGIPDGKSGEQLEKLGPVDSTSIFEVTSVPKQEVKGLVDLSQVSLSGNPLKLQSQLLRTHTAKQVKKAFPNGATKRTQECFQNLTNSLAA